MLLYSPSEDRLFRQPELALDPWSWRWQPLAEALPSDVVEISAEDAVRHVYGMKRCRRLPVAIIGPKQAEAYQLQSAEQLGAALAGLGVPVLCGGKLGIMEAAARGAHNAGGLTIGILPDTEWQAANDYISLPLATGIRSARNYVVAGSALALVAVGGHYGTITEAAFGLNFGKPVIGLHDAPQIDGVQHVGSVEEAIEALLPILLHLPKPS